MIPLSTSLAVICVLSIWTTKCAAGCGDGQEEVDGRCCDLCPPGTYMTEYCSEHRPTTVCSPCKEGSFSDQYNLFDRCEECRSCQEYAQKCTPTTNANCSCGPGFLCSNNACSECEENKCITGEKLKSTASECEPSCPDNAYFDAKENICKMHRDDRDSKLLILGIGFVLLSLILVVFLSRACIKNLRKHKAYNNPIEVLAISTNTNDFHLSKEESGLELIMQDESKSTNSLGLLHLEKVSTCYCSGGLEQGT